MGPTIETLNDLASAGPSRMLRATWQGGLAIAAAWVLVRCQPRLPPRVACWAWRLADLKLVVALLWATPLLLPLLPPSPARDRSRRRPSRSRTLAEPGRRIRAVTEPAGEPAEPPCSIGRVPPAWCWFSGCRGSSARRSWREGMDRRGPSAAVLPPIDRPDLRAPPSNWPASSACGGVPKLRAGPVVTRPMLVGAFRPAILLPIAML